MKHNRRHFLTTTAAATTLTLPTLTHHAQQPTNQNPTPPTNQTQPIIRPPQNKTILLSCKLGMIPREQNGKKLTLTQRLQLATQAGFDGVDFDEAAQYTPAQARQAVTQSGTFVHNAINHAHWQKRLTSPNQTDRSQSIANIEHCIRISHAAGGSGVLIVIGRDTDGPPQTIQKRAHDAIRQTLPLAAALGQPILIENVWNGIFYNHTKPAPPEQTPDQFIQFIDNFNSPWVGMYYDIGNHWKYGQPKEWILKLGHRCRKLDIKDFSRTKDNWADIGQGDLPWNQVRDALNQINFTGWATAEVGGGNLQRLRQIRQQMQQALTP